MAKIDVPPSNAETSLTALSIAATRPALSFFKTQKVKMKGEEHSEPVESPLHVYCDVNFIFCVTAQRCETSSIESPTLTSGISGSSPDYM